MLAVIDDGIQIKRNFRENIHKEQERKYYGIITGLERVRIWRRD